MYYVLCCAFANLPNDRMKAHSKTDNYECKQWTLCNGECISSKLANDISFVFCFCTFYCYSAQDAFVWSEKKAMPVRTSHLKYNVTYIMHLVIVRVL